MGWTHRRRIFALGGATALALALLAVVPALGQTDPPDAVSFVAGSGSGAFHYGETQPVVTASNGCQLVASSGPQFVALSGGPQSNKVPGFFSNSIGIKSPGSNSNGIPCSQVDGTELLTLRQGADLARPFEGLRFDLEMTGNAVVRMTLSNATESKIYSLYTGTSWNTLCGPAGLDPLAPGCAGDEDPLSAPYEILSGSEEPLAGCNAPQNSGPNSGANDNCVWTVDPGIVFDRIDLTVDSGGTVSLEGGSDTGLPSLFYVASNRAPVANDQTEDIDYAADTTYPFVLDASDPDGDPLTVTLDDSGNTAAGGSVVVDSGLNVTYTPPEGFTGSDSFSYSVSDGEFSDSAVVTIRELFTCADDTVPFGDGIVSGFYARKGACSDDKVYLLDIITTVNGASVRFVPQSADADNPVRDCSVLPTPAACSDEYVAELTFAPRNMANAPDTGKLQYDPVNRDAEEAIVFRDMRWCRVDPYEVEADTGVWPDSDQILPLPVDGVGESWCIVWVATGIGETGKTVTTWSVYGIGDPIKGIS